MYDEYNIPVISGSEHTKSLTSFPMEVQLLHYKEEHTNISEALAEGHHDSLAMLSIFLSVSKHFTHTS